MTIFCFSLFSYALLLFTIANLPEKSWDYLLKFNSLWLTTLNRTKKDLPLIGEIECGRELLIAFTDCEAKISLGIKILPSFLPRYKFYTNLLEQLFETHRRLGIGIKKFIPEIRSGLIRDLQFEKKVLDEIIGGLLQFLVIATTTWSFVFLSASLVQIPLSKSTIFFMLALQLGGVVVFFQLVKIVKSKTFLKFSKAIEELYLFSTLLEIGLPLNEILLRSGILQGNLINFKIFENLSDRIKKLIARLKETGLTPRDETQEIIREIWHLQEENFQKFTKIVQVLKFSILVFFFLPAYFLYLYSIFKFFMEQ
ncbi:MAG: hypothetical protein PHY93_00515 [Bacteriovorax sp.]|nr:hypothetical protein [Bacteriovorax sp.]